MFPRKSSQLFNEGVIPLQISRKSLAKLLCGIEKWNFNPAREFITSSQFSEEISPTQILHEV